MVDLARKISAIVKQHNQFSLMNKPVIRLVLLTLLIGVIGTSSLMNSSNVNLVYAAGQPMSYNSPTKVGLKLDHSEVNLSIGCN